MPIVYALVARGKTVLAEWTATSGNFPTVTRVLLGKISAEDGRMSYVYDRYVFHYINQDGITYLCMADDDFTRRLPFAFLEDIMQRFLAMYGDRVHSAIAFAMNDSFSPILEKQMDFYNTDPSADSVGRVKAKLESVREVMVENIDKVLDRGEKMDLLVERTDRLNQTAFRFERKSNQLKRAMWWQNMKFKVFLGATLVVLVYAGLAYACGLTLRHC